MLVASQATIKTNIIALSKRIQLLIEPYSISNASLAIDTNFQFFLDSAYSFCEQIDNIIFENSLKLGNHSLDKVNQPIILNNKWKDKIRSYVMTIKTTLDSTNFENERLKDSIYSKLKAFEKELDKSKTSIQSFQEAFLDMSLVIGQAAKNIKPAVQVALKVMKIFGHSLDITNSQLLPPDDHKLLPPPEDDNED